MHYQNYRLFIFLSLFLSILAGCTLPGGQVTVIPASPTKTPQEEPTTLKEETPTNGNTGDGGMEPTEVSSSQNPLPPAVNLEKSRIDLQKLGTDIVGGGGGNGCDEFLASKTEQEIILWADGSGWKLCFINFPLGTALVKLSTQSGMFDISVNLEPEFEGVEEYALYIDLPASVRRDGPLHVEFSVADVTFAETIDIQTMDLVGIYKDSVNTLHAGYQSYPNYNFGEQIELLGVGLLPSTTVYVGIYGILEFNGSMLYPLVDQFEVTTNEAGEFLGAVPITEKYHQGKYIIYYDYNRDVFENRRGEDIFTVGGISPIWQPCPADYASSLRVGDIGIVSDNPPLPNNVRKTPALSGELIGQLQTGQQFIILDGPVCDGGWVWWYVQSAIDYGNYGRNEVLSGWTSEGDLNKYWLLPYDPNEEEEPKGEG